LLIFPKDFGSMLKLPIHLRKLSGGYAPTPMSHSHHQHQLVNFLQTNLAVPPESIELALRRTEQTPSLLPMILWQYGLVTTDQLEQIFDWLETSRLPI
jgi:hypothetical protein